jgi:DICT domain-containing protein
MASDGLTATELAELTGVAPGTLRVWETRYGFPAAQRLPGSRKRYTPADAEQITAVLEHRDAGLSLAAAIERVRGDASAAAPAPAPERPQSMFAALREARPDLPVRAYPKPMLTALSRAIEDEHAARATGGVLVGSFQRERHYRASERRWQTLARTAELAVVMADFDELRDAPGGPVEIPLPPADPIEREWTVVLASAAGSACLAAWEVPAPRRLPDHERRFELIWSCDPSAAHTVVMAACQIIGAIAPHVLPRVPPAVLAPPSATPANLRFSDDLMARAFAYLAGPAAGES